MISGMRFMLELCSYFCVLGIVVYFSSHRRLALEKEATFETIERLVESTFNVSPNEFKLNYVDTDNDKVSISTDEELKEALQQAQGLPLKINVQKLPGKVQDTGSLQNWIPSPLISILSKRKTQDEL